MGPPSQRHSQAKNVCSKVRCELKTPLRFAVAPPDRPCGVRLQKRQVALASLASLSRSGERPHSEENSFEVRKPSSRHPSLPREYGSPNPPREKARRNTRTAVQPLLGEQTPGGGAIVVLVGEQPLARPPISAANNVEVVGEDLRPLKLGASEERRSVAQRGVRGDVSGTARSASVATAF